MILHITKDAGHNHYWLGGYADGYLIYPDDCDKLVEHCVEMAEVLGIVMSDLGINNVEELYSEYKENKNGKAN